MTWISCDRLTGDEFATQSIEQLTYEPNVETRNRKPLGYIPTEWDISNELWELRVGEFRVFYEFELNEKIVMVHGVREKPPHKTTGDIL